MTRALDHIGAALVGAALVAPSLPLVGCAAQTAAPPTGLTASVAQFREDEVRGQLRVRLVATRPMTVTTLTLVWPGLPDLPTTTPEYPLQPGVAVDLPLPLAPAACGQPPQADVTPPPMDAVAVVSGERVPITDAEATLTRIFTRSCRQQALAAALSASFSDRWATTTDGTAVAGTLQLRRGLATGPVTVTGIDGSVLLTPTADVPVTMTGDALDLPVSVTSSGRCDGHALGESKQTFVFDVLIDDAPMTVEIPQSARPMVWAAMLRACSRTPVPGPVGGN